MQKSLSVVAAVGIAFAVATAAVASPLVYYQLNDGQSVYGPGQLWPATGIDSEIADDFEVIGSVDRVVVEGFIWGVTPQWQGVAVRFYEFGADGAPGALQRETFVAVGDPNLTVDDYGLVDVRLATPFDATGRHFLVVQPVVDSWTWWSADSNAPRGPAFWYRDRTAGETWHHGDAQVFSQPNADLAFALYGTVTGPGTITNLSTDALARSGYLEIFGANFSDGGTVSIGGADAAVADWTSTRIVAYVPEAAPLGATTVLVTTPGGVSNAVALSVSPRQADGLVNWRLRMEGAYSMVRPACGPDGTIYAIDVDGRLYAVARDGALRWIARGAGNKALAVGANGIIFTASESDVKAFDPTGALQWTFVQDPRAFILVGMAIGPDGNLYGVATQGLGVFSLTPAGTLRWTDPESYRRRIVDYGEVVFGPNNGRDQLYFYANDHTRALRLEDGASVFTLPPTGQPVVSPLDGTMIARGVAYSPTGQQQWSLDPGTVSVADVAADGTIYVVKNGSELDALQPNGVESWHMSLPPYMGAPNVDAGNSIVVVGSGGTLDMSGFLLGIDPSARQEAWRIDLPAEETDVFNNATGQYGFNQFVDTRACFTGDGSSVYLVTAIATGGMVTDRSFLYSIATRLSNQTTDVGSPSAEGIASLGSFPNPFGARARIDFALARAQRVHLTVYDVHGRLVSHVLRGVELGAGRHAATWEPPSGTPNGVYVYRLRAAAAERSGRLLLVR